MTKSELVAKIAEGANLTNKDAAAAVEATMTIITDALAKGQEVRLVGFGTFEVRKRAARDGRNPQDPSKVIHIPAKKVPAFKPGKLLKEAVSGK